MMRRQISARGRLVVCAAALAILAVPFATAQDLSPQALMEQFEKKTTVHQLENGWTFIIIERPTAPVFSFATIVDVGGAQEVPGITGLAHMFEHMAFKGTPNIGTKDYQAEKKALAEVESAYMAYEAARRGKVDAAEVEKRLEAFKEKQEAAFQYVAANEFGEIVEREGGTGLNAFTSSDMTGYFYSLPANKFELFAYLESERFLHPVFREFYKERDVVQEERRMRTESTPFGRLFEQAMATAFLAHPYKQPVVGYMSDLQSFTATDAEAFYKKHYVPANMVTALAGQLKAAEVIPVIEKYFGRIPAGPKPEPLRTIEPKQIAEKQVVVQDPAQPIYMEAYHRPSSSHPDAAVFTAIQDIMSNGRTSRLYRSLVRDKKIATFANAIPSFPGSKYPSLFVFLAAPAKDRANEEVQTAIRDEVERLLGEPISESELKRFRTRSIAQLVRGLGSNFGLATQMAVFQTQRGDWRELFRDIERIQKVTEEDIKRVAKETFQSSNRTVAMIVTEEAAGAK